MNRKGSAARSTAVLGSWLTVALLLGVATPASAQLDFFWVGPNAGADPADGDFQVDTNWLDADTQTFGLVPSTFDTALHFAITSETPYVVTSSVDWEIATALVVSEAGGTADNVTYDYNGGVLTANGGALQDQIGFGAVTSGGNGSMTLLDGTYNAVTSLNVAADLAADPAGSATMTIGAGATFVSDSLFLGLSVDTIGGFGAPDQAGTLNVVDGGVYDSLQPQIGTDAGTAGIVNVDGAGSQMRAYLPGADLATARAIAVGLEGTGELNVTDGGSVLTQFLGVAGGFTGLTGIGGGTVNADNGTITHEAVFDTDGSGLPVVIGDGGGTGTMSLANNSTFSSDFLVIVGGTGDQGTVNIESGSDYTSSQWRLGEDLGATGTMNVDGAGTTMVADFGCFVGYNGAGEFNVTNGASARFVPTPAAGTGFLGLGRIGATSSGVMTVDGAGSTVSVEGALANSLSVGRDGQGQMTVSGGGLVTTVAGGDVAIGRTATATGSVLVTGAGSILRGHGGIAVGGTVTAGAGGVGSLTISNGGSIQGAQLWVYSGDSVTVNTGGFGTIGTIGTVVNTPNTLTVRTGGQLRGVGTINGNVANVTGGVVGAGATTTGNGLLTINGNLNNGNLTAGAGGTVQMHITTNGTAGTNYDSLVVSGDVLLAGILNLQVAGGYVPNGAHQFNVITGSSNIQGAFESITNRVINPAAVGGTVWGDYREDNPGVGTDRYYVAPRRLGDFNGTGGVNGADFTIWADNFGDTWATFGQGDANGDRTVNGADFTVWADNFGQTSIADELVPISTWGAGVDELAFDEAPSIPSVNDVALQEAGLRTIGTGLGTGFDGSMNPVPEPSTFVLGGLALIGMAGFALRRRNG